MLQIIKAKTASHYEHTRRLFARYADSLGFDIEFQGFSDELDALPGAYAPPFGCILLAVISELFVGCVALRRIDKSTCEMKRLFVAPEHRDKGIGKALASLVIDEAQKLSYKRMRLDTVTSMQAANALYASLGFKPIEAYCHNPLEGATFYELHLNNA
jgi:ribosomal protein S18 acetylase RimI-like enzyme